MSRASICASLSLSHTETHTPTEKLNPHLANIISCKFSKDQQLQQLDGRKQATMAKTKVPINMSGALWLSESNGSRMVTREKTFPVKVAQLPLPSRKSYYWNNLELCKGKTWKKVAGSYMDTATRLVSRSTNGEGADQKNK